MHRFEECPLEIRIKISKALKKAYKEGRRKPITYLKKYQFMKGNIPLKPFEKGHIPWNKGKAWNKNHKVSEETKKKISLVLKGRHLFLQTEFKKGHKVPQEWKESCRRKIHKRLENDEYRIELNKKRLTACGFKPNKKELFLDSLIQSNFPNQWKYVGNGEVVLGAGCPDWINTNGQKKVILHHGIYWHLWRLQKLQNNLNLTKQEIEEKDIKNYKKYGFKCLIIWEDELKNTQQIIEKLRGFG